MKKFKDSIWWIVIALIIIIFIAAQVIGVISFFDSITIEGMVSCSIVILFFIGAALFNKSKRKSEEFDNELKKEKDNYKLLCENYYNFCKYKYIETQKKIVSLHERHNLGVDDYGAYRDEIWEEKSKFYDCTKKERDRYIHGEVNNVLEFKYQSEEVIVFEETIKKICSAFHDLISNA